MELWLVKTMGPTLRAADPEAAAALQSLGAGEAIKCEIRKPRNVRFHRKFFALLHMVYENQERFTSFDHFRKACLIEAGFYEDRRLLDGTTVRDARSISFARCDELEFGRIYDAVLRVILEHVLPGMDAGDLEREVEQYLHGWS